MKKLNQKKKTHRIALYIRVSTEEQASNPEGSIKSQEQRLRQNVQFRNLEEPWGEITDVFIDRAKSGKDTNRPELQRLLKRIMKKEVTMIMVTELSRLSRNIKDFCEIWDLMRDNDCEFQSLREQFDTTSAAGEMVLMTLANIAQFERKQVSERVRSNFKARSERGLFNGGSIPLGLKSHPDKRGHLIVDDEEAGTVREVFSTFLRERNLSKTGKSLNVRGIRIAKRKRAGGPPRLDHFTVGNLYGILTQRAYIGERPVNKNDEISFVKACWEPIVSKDDFESVQAILKSNRYKPSSYLDQRYPYLLSGLAFCSCCGDSLAGKSANGNGGKIPYYEHSWSLKKQSLLKKKSFDCDPTRVLAKKLEPAVWEKVVELITRPAIAERIIAKAKGVHQTNPHLIEQQKLEGKIQTTKEQIEALAEHLTKIPKGVSPEPIFMQMQKLGDLKHECEEKLAELRSNTWVSEVPSGLKDYLDFCKTIRTKITRNDGNEELKNQILRRLIQKVEVTPKSFRVFYFAGEDVIGFNHEKVKEIQNVTDVENKKSEGSFDASDLFLFSGSKRLTSGWGGYKPSKLLNLLILIPN